METLLEDKNAVIYGGGGSIGGAVARTFAREGARVFLADELARSENVWERRSAIVATSYFIKQGDISETFQIAEVLLDDDHDLIHKATGGWLREAGKKDRQRLLGFLDEYAAMPRTMLRYAIEHLDKEQRAHYLSMKKKAAQAR